MTLVAEKFSELGLGVVGNLLRDVGVAVVANQRIGRIVFDLSGLSFRLHNFIGTLVGFRVVVGSNGKAVEVVE